MARGRQIFKQLYNINKGEQIRVFYTPIYTPKHDFIAKIIVKTGPKQRFLRHFDPFWCTQQELNLHGSLHKILSLARLPIPP